ncbi:pyridoxamine 5'-phosphate oxidase family protein [Sphingomonas sp. TZW2008]|uniref:pyridoxamine 5'-phosphate oxidase family protein n=1 Tax=Sphingomonas sp. TZW2008 TaxID=1917973 RepID=UPI000A26DA9A|nr:pyridoxamine 5'-phosphate oxidase family protein [Sphingomonas sp. TZW2008]
MAEFFPALTPAHRDFVARQPVFFVATAAAGVRINLSPKGMDSFRILDERTVAYLDVAGSGNETNAHLLADGRITIMFCAFDQPALIFRIYGHGRAVLPQDAEWQDLHAQFTPLPGTRQIFVVAIDEVQTSCGWGVPQMTLDHPRETLNKYNAKYSDDERLAYWRGHEGVSIDGLPTRVPDALPA